MKLNKRELATILAALRYWARMTRSGTPSEEYAVATDFGTLKTLTSDQIDRLCERINTQ
jgi:hypothetical protein